MAILPSVLFTLQSKVDGALAWCCSVHATVSNLSLATSVTLRLLW